VERGCGWEERERELRDPTAQRARCAGGLTVAAGSNVTR
jgi:hypothetical protein